VRKALALGGGSGVREFSAFPERIDRRSEILSFFSMWRFLHDP